jgi:hypothetical protein
MVLGGYTAEVDMKLYKNITLFLYLIFLIVLIGCGQSGTQPERVASLYLDAYYTGNYEGAYQYLSEKDKAVMSLRQYQSEQTEEMGLIPQLMSSRISYEIQNVTVVDDEAQVQVSIMLPDFGSIVMDILGSAFMSAFRDEIDEDEIERMVGERLEGEDIPMTTTSETLTLIKENGRWRIFLDFERQKMITNLLSEARQFEDEKKLSAAKEKYKKVLELNSKHGEAFEKISELEKEIEVFREKQEYIGNVELYDLTARYYQTYFDVRVPGVEFKLRNNGDRTLKRVEVTVYFKDSEGKIITEETYLPVLVSRYSISGDNRPLRPNYIWQLERGKFYQAKSVPSEWQEGAVSAQITDIEFDD